MPRLANLGATQVGQRFDEYRPVAVFQNQRKAVMGSKGFSAENLLPM